MFGFGDSGLFCAACAAIACCANSVAESRSEDQNFDRLFVFFLSPGMSPYANLSSTDESSDSSAFLSNLEPVLGVDFR